MSESRLQPARAEIPRELLGGAPVPAKWIVEIKGLFGWQRYAGFVCVQDADRVYKKLLRRKETARIEYIG